MTPELLMIEASFVQMWEGGTKFSVLETLSKKRSDEVDLVLLMTWTEDVASGRRGLVEDQRRILVDGEGIGDCFVGS